MASRDVLARPSFSGGSREISEMSAERVNGLGQIQKLGSQIGPRLANGNIRVASVHVSCQDLASATKWKAERRHETETSRYKLNSSPETWPIERETRGESDILPLPNKPLVGETLAPSVHSSASGPLREIGVHYHHRRRAT